MPMSDVEVRKESSTPSAASRLPLRDVRRLVQILRIAAAHGLGRYIERLNLVSYLKGGRAPELAGAGEARRLREALEALGPSFVKFGQMLSARRDLFSDEVIAELQSLQDRVPPFPASEARTIIEQELGRSVDELLTHFDDTPLAAASIAQVHCAELPDGTDVIVKVQRPGIEEMLRADIEILYFLARLLVRFVPESRRYEPVTLVDEFADHIADELDFTREGRYAERFGANFRDEPLVYVPPVYWEASSRRVITMAHSHGRRLSADYPADPAERARLADTLMRLFLAQILEHGFFHGDPHPGNVFYLPDGRICFHDFGIVGRLSASDRENLRNLFFAAVTRDAQWLADTYLEMGGAPAETDRAAFAKDIGVALEEYYAASARGTSFGAVLQEFIRLGHRYRIRLLRETLLVAKVFMILESVTRSLDPAFDMFVAFERHAPGLIVRDFLPTVDRNGGLAKAYRMFSGLRRVAGELPETLTALTRQLRQGGATLRVHHEPLGSLETHIDRASNRLSLSLIIAAIVIGSSLVMTFHAGPHYQEIPVIGLIGYVIAAVMGLGWAIAILRSGRF